MLCVCVCVSASGYASCDSSPYVASSNSFWLSVCPPILKDLLLGCACCTIHIHHTYTDFFFISPHWACACDNVCDVCDLLNYLISISWSAPLFSFYTPNSPSSTLAPTAAAKNRLCLPFEFHTKFEFAINNFSRTNDVYECVVCAHRRTGINRKKTHIYTTWEYVKMYTQAAAVCCTAKCRMRQSFGSVALFSSFLVLLHIFFYIFFLS